MFWEHENGRAVRVGDWKLTALRNGGWQLFNMKNDYSETNNVAAEYPEKVKELKSLYNNWARSVGLSVPAEISDTEKQLVFYYPFDGDLQDKSAGNHPLTPSANGHGFAEGQYGEALTLSGNAQYLDLNVNNLVNTQNTQYTICAWVYNEDTTLPTSGQSQDGYYFRDQVIIAQKDNAGTGRITLYTRIENPQIAGEPRFYYDNFIGGNHNRSTDGAFKRGQWQHVAVVCNPVDRNITFYVDGERDCTIAASNFEACTGGFRIGGHKANKDYWHGKIDELYFFRGLLSAEEIRQIRDNKYLPTGINIMHNEECIMHNAPSAVYDLQGRKIEILNVEKLNKQMGQNRSTIQPRASTLYAAKKL